MQEKQNKKDIDIGPISVIVAIVIPAITIVAGIAGELKDNSTLQLIVNLFFAVAIVVCIICSIVYNKHRAVYIVITIILFIICFLCDWYFWHPPEPPQPTPTPIITATPITPAPTRTPIPLPTSGTSASGSILRDVQYNDSGRIVRASEKLGGKWVEWEYVYSDTGSFKYRKRNIGSMDGTLTEMKLSEKDITCVILNRKIENCVGFTLSYSVSNVNYGAYEGTREVHISSDAVSWRDTASWRYIGTFEYEVMSRIEIPFVLDPAESFNAVTAPRVERGSSSFDEILSIVDVWVADYEYVEIVTEE